MIRLEYYYYYDYGGLPQNKKEYDVNMLINFIENTTEVLSSLILNPNFSKGFYSVFNEQEKKGFKLSEWVEDVKTKIKVEIRNLKISTFTNETLIEVWDKMDTVGLTGVQLESKLKYWDKLFSKVEDWIQQKAKTITTAFGKDLENALQATNIILHSIASFLLGVEPLKELKDFFELSLKFQ